MLEADLNVHRRETSALIRQVNALEATVAEARQAVPAGPPAADDLAAQVRSAREQAAAPLPRETRPPAPVDERAVEDDLAARRARLIQ
jgi:hypothetical protein